MKKKTIINILIIFLISRIIIFSGFYIAEKFIQLDVPENAYNVENKVINHFVLYDSYHYINIANHGYNNYDKYEKLENHEYIENMEGSFFPIYPLIISLFSSLTKFEASSVGFIISNISFLLSLIIMKKILIKRNINSNLPIWLLALFPTSMFFSSVYSESIFLLWSLLFFYALENNDYKFMYLFGILASATRITGLVFVFILFVKLIRDKKNVFLSIVPSLGFLGFIASQYIIYNDPLAFLTNQKGFQREFVGAIKFLTSDIISGNMFINSTIFINSIIVIVIYILTIFVVFNKKLPIEYKVFMLFNFILSTTTIYTGDNGTFFTLGFSRYMMIVFPYFMIINIKKLYFKLPILVSSSALLLANSIPFYYKYFIG